ncbi:hypothetical protein ABZ541_14300 [Micromonospora sediminicola]|uniref:hypothetical protein n=1 Tax=Micromonospora sediminicola TaxID=946078 RepID=UPI0033FD5E43
MKRTRILAVVCLLVAGWLLARQVSWLGTGPERVMLAGTWYSLAVRPVDPVEVRVTSGRAEEVTLTAVMPSMGHAQSPVGTVRAGADRFVAEQDVFTMAGVWELSVTVSGTQGSEVITFSTAVAR